MEGADDHPLPHIEAVGVTPLHPGIEVQDGATRFPGPVQQVVEQPGTYALTAGGHGGNEVVHVELSPRGRARHQAPTSHTDAATLVIGSGEAQTLWIPFFEHCGERVGTQLIPELAEYG